MRWIRILRRYAVRLRNRSRAESAVHLLSMSCLMGGLIGLHLFALPLPATGIEQWIVGQGGHPWEEVGTSDGTEVTDGRLQPRETDTQQNLALQATVSTPSFTIEALGTLKLIADGDPSTAFEMTLEGVSGVQIDFDLGGLFFVNRIMFAPFAYSQARILK